MDLGEAVSAGFRRPEVQERYERYAREHHGDLDDLPNLAETMFNAGERHAIRVMEQFSDILPRLSHIEERVAEARRLLLALWEEDA
jgi:hypothetical protein